jgi:hypothetical protein
MPRRELDFYETPKHYTAALLNEVNVFGRVYESCVGDRAIADMLERVPSVRRVYTNDIDKKRDADTHYDARTFQPEYPQPFDWSITNLPFVDAFDIITNNLPLAKHHAYLVRLSFLEPTEERADLLENNPPNQIIVLPRHSFRNNDAGKKATDNVTCCWLVWHGDDEPRRIAVYGRAKSKTIELIRSLP